jgi:hypothetical protein
MESIFSITIVQVGLSIIISWALFAIFCSMIHELICELLAERGKFLKKKIFEELNDLSNKMNWGYLVYMNNSVDLLTSKAQRPTSNIPTKLFAESLIRTIANSHMVSILANKNNPVYTNEILNRIKLATLHLKQSDVIGMLTQALNSAEARALDANHNINETLVYEHLVENISAWYDSVMDQVSDWYKKKTRLRLFYLSFIVAVALNINSLTLFQFFNSTPDASKSFNAYYEKNHKRLEQLAIQYSDSASVRDTLKIKHSIQQDLNDLETSKASFDSLATVNKIPIGWNCPDKAGSTKKATCFDPKNFFLYLFGWIISAFAASFGAPFWFDTLKKIYAIKNN